MEGIEFCKNYKGMFWDTKSSYGYNCFVSCSGISWETMINDPTDLENLGVQDELNQKIDDLAIYKDIFWGIDSDGCLCASTNNFDLCSDEPWEMKNAE